MPRKLFRRWMPDSKKLREHKWLAWLDPWLHHPHLWHVSREGIARGAAIGGFFGILLPIAQIPTAAVVAIVLRANLPMAAVGTFVTNPFTFAPIYFFAYHVGLFFMGIDQASQLVHTELAAVPEHLDWFSKEWFEFWYQRIGAMGKPLFVGLLTLGALFSALSYFAVHWFWRMHTLSAWRSRIHRKKAAPKADAD